MISITQKSPKNQIRTLTENSARAGDNKRTHQTIEQLLVACGLSVTERQYRGYKLYFIDLRDAA